MQIVLSFKIMCNQESHHTNWFQPLSCHQCAQEVDRSMPLETNICPTVNTWTSSSHEFRVKKLWLNTCWLLQFFQWNLFEVEELGAWATQWTSPPQFALVCISSFLLETVKWKNKANHKTRVRLNENFSLTGLTFKCIFWWYMHNEVCNKCMWHVLVLLIPAETPSWPGTLVRTLKNTCPRLSCLLLQSCWYTCHFIQIQHLTHLQKLICLKILHLLKWLQLTAQLYFVAAAIEDSRQTHRKWTNEVPLVEMTKSKS